MSHGSSWEPWVGRPIDLGPITTVKFICKLDFQNSCLTNVSSWNLRIICVPALQSADNVIDHGFWFVWVLCQLLCGYILQILTVFWLSFSLCTFKIMLCVIIVTNSLIQLRFQILRMLVEKGLVVSYFVALCTRMKADPTWDSWKLLK